MNQRASTRSLLALCFCVGVTAPGARAEDLPEAVEQCLECHSEEAGKELENGDELDLQIDGQAFVRSSHGRQLVCTDCHEGYDEDHPMDLEYASRRDYVIRHYGSCKKCHYDTYSRTLESVHTHLLQEGLENAPVCTDCHGAHDIQDPHQKQVMLAKSCAACHADVYQQYARSVHGKALVEDAIQDVPACADCHTHHSIEQADTLAFRLDSPQICINCHGDEELMARYDIPSDVATTYLADFHGVTASLAGEGEQREVVVTCIDCHGVHDIASPQLVGGEAMKQRVETVCASCHPNAGQDFPAAWLSHYRPSLRHAPLVYLVDRMYMIFIPFVVLGLLLQVLLHLYRVAVRR